MAESPHALTQGRRFAATWGPRAPWEGSHHLPICPHPLRDRRGLRPAVVHPRHLVLRRRLAVRLHPPLEPARASPPRTSGRSMRQVPGPVGGVVLVQPAQRRRPARRRTGPGPPAAAGELDQVAVVPGLLRVGREHRADVEVAASAPRPPRAACATALLDLLADQVLAERRQEVLRPPGEPDRAAGRGARTPPCRRAGTPTARRRWSARPRTARRSPPSPACAGSAGRLGVPELVHRHELEEHVVVRHHPQQAVPRVLGGDEPLGAGYTSQKSTRVAADLLAEQVAVRVELGAAVDDQPQRRPDLGDALACRSPPSAGRTAPASTPARR